jgi:hypothetical protein|tara:strand:- start:1145 stop:1477 length:333 start_codon:yes stop_codon:yes gene_type:complete
MANAFKTYASRGVGNSLTAVGSHTVASSTTETVIGLTVSNVTASAVNVTVAYNDGANDTNIVKNAPVASGGALTPIGGDQKIVLEVGDSIKVSSNTASSIDAVMSVLEQT